MRDKKHREQVMNDDEYKLNREILDDIVNQEFTQSNNKNFLI